jgi:diphthamide synthase subunit DPH2
MLLVVRGGARFHTWSVALYERIPVMALSPIRRRVRSLDLRGH